MDSPTTPRSRRAAWRSDAIALVKEFQACHRGEGRESFPPWRVGYMAGLSEVNEAGAAYYLMKGHRTEPHQMHQDIVIPKEGTPSTGLLDLLCWHYDQDVRRFELDHVDHLDLWHRLPSGPLLVDPLMHVALLDAGLDECEFAHRIRDADGFGTKKVVTARMGRGSGVATADIKMRYNEIHARFELPDSGGAVWSRGHLTVNATDMPETVLTAARGRPLSDIVHHEMIDRAVEMRVTAITQTAIGKYTIMTDRARADGMMGLPQRRTARAA